LNKIKHYLRVGHFFHKDFLYSIYAYLRYSLYEKQIVKRYQKVVLVSQTDIDYLRRGEDKNKFICLRNGLNIPQFVSKKTTSNLFRIGILSVWDSFQSNEENRWFLKKYVPKYVKNHPDVEFILAGRGSRIHEYISVPGVKVIGEIDSLDTFFSNIDVLLSPNPKGCGILNRVLDAIAYKTPVIGHTGSFSGFKGMEKGFMSFDDYDSFCTVVEKIKNKDLQASLVSESYKFALEYFNWEKNYKEFIDQYVK
jgi:glycosyltransferase involved in cell wall biosynthesis